MRPADAHHRFNTTDNIPQSEKLSSGEEDKKIWQKAHILFHPDTYIGSVKKKTEKQWIFKNNKIIKEEITFVPLLYKIFDKVLVDAAAGNKPRDPKVTNIRVNIDVDHNQISVWSNTVDMDVMDANRCLYDSFWCSSESGNFLTESVIDTVAAKHHYVRYKQVFKGNRRVQHISFSNFGINSTVVSFIPDLAKFGMDHLENDIISLMKRRVVELAGCLGGKGVKVELDGTSVLPTTFEDYVKLYPQTFSIFQKFNDRLEVCVGVADDHFEQAGAYIDSKEKHIRYCDSINKGLMADSQRLIPSVVDGLNPDQRKTLFCAFRKPVIEKIGVYDLSGYVYERSAYDDCEASLVGTIISMAQNYVGSNNINLLQPIGLFGTRQMGGKDHGNAKHLDTQLNPITRYIFNKADELLLNYLNDLDGQSIEPAWFIPIIPMVLVNGSEGTGTGWSSFVPSYNPRDIIANLKRLLDGEAMVPMLPWYKGFKGAIVKTEDTRYITKGLIEEKSESVVSITELPVRMWNREFKEFLKAARQGGEHKTPFIKAYVTYNDHTIDIIMTEDQMTTARQEGLVEKFKLTTELSTSDMHLFDAKGVLKKYETPEQILKEFYDLRLEFYEKRRNAKLCELKIAVLVLENKLRFIRLFRNRKITLGHTLCAELEKQGFDRGTEIEGKPDELYEFRKKWFKEETEVEEEVAGGEEKPQGNASETVSKTEYNYLLFMEVGSLTDVFMQELRQEIDAKEKEIDVLSKATSKSLWRRDLNALDHQLQLDANYPRMDENNLDDGPEIAQDNRSSKEESPFSQWSNKRLKR